jgi:hypothetical protein
VQQLALDAFQFGAVLEQREHGLVQLEVEIQYALAGRLQRDRRDRGVYEPADGNAGLAKHAEQQPQLFTRIAGRQCEQ